MNVTVSRSTNNYTGAMKSLRIVCAPEELEQGLFGQTFYHLLQVLPYLLTESIFPQWELRTLHYGDPPDQLTVPGVLDLAYEAPSGPFHTITLSEMRRRHAHVLGNDWHELNRIWSSYFRIPERIHRQADAIFPTSRVVGVHYRGTDKQTSLWDSNPISQEHFIVLLRDYLSQRTDTETIFVATDEPSFIEHLRQSFDVPVVTVGEVEFHLAQQHKTTRAEKADRAMLDCVLLSRCASVVETSSALPSFAKLLNPRLEIYRCAASKLFGRLYTNMPYFPVAYIPVLPVHRDESQEILRKTMFMDWTEQPETEHFLQPFVAAPRWKLNHSVFRRAERFGIDRFVGRILSGYR